MDKWLALGGGNGSFQFQAAMQKEPRQPRTAAQSRKSNLFRIAVFNHIFHFVQQQRQSKKAAPAEAVAVAPAPAIAKTIFCLCQRQAYPPRLHDYNINLLYSALPPCLYSSIKKAQMRFRFSFCPFSAHFLAIFCCSRKISSFKLHLTQKVY